jgi:hypothetical protein
MDMRLLPFRRWDFSPLVEAGDFRGREKNSGLNFRALRREDSRTYENDCLHSLKAMPPEPKKDARLKPAATFAGAEIGLRRVRNETRGTEWLGHRQSQMSSIQKRK